MLLYLIAVFVAWFAVWRFLAARMQQKESRLRVHSDHEFESWLAFEKLAIRIRRKLKMSDLLNP
jgi:hypothetical protein